MRTGSRSMIGALVVVVVLILLSVATLVVGFVGNSVALIYVSVTCSFLASIAFIMLLVRLIVFLNRR